MADALDTTVCERMVGARGNCVDAEIFVESAGEFETELKAIVGKEEKKGIPREGCSGRLECRPCQMR